MANVNHNTLTDPYIHEPKGASTAASGAIYIADGAGSGTWKQLHNYVNGYVAFDSATPAYSHSVTTSFTVLNPTFVIGLSDEWTGLSSPNARLKYTGTVTTTAKAIFSINFKNNSGTNRDLELAIYKNGTLLAGAQSISTAVTGEWKLLTVTGMTTFVANDYFEIFVRGSAAFTLLVAAASLTVVGAPT